MKYLSRRSSGPQQPVHHLQPPKLAAQLPRLLAVSAALAATAWLALPTPPPPIATALNAAYSAPPDERALLALLQQLHRTWNPAVRQSLLANVADQKDLLLRPLRVLLAQPHPHPLLAEAMALAIALHDESLAAQIIHWTTDASGAARSLAIDAAAQHDAVGADRLGDLLADDDAAVRAAAAAIAIDRGTLPWDRVAGCLVALPLNLRQHLTPPTNASAAEPLAAALWKIATEDRGELAHAAMQVLGRLGLAASFAGAAASQLGNARPATALALLDLIAAAGVSVPDPAPLQRWALDSTAELALRTRAFHALECTRSGNLAQLAAATAELPPLLRLYAARCGIAQGDHRGIASLLQLAASDDSQVATQSRILLGHLSGLGPDASIDEWQHQLAGQSFGQVRMPPPELPDLPAAPGN